MNPVALFAHTAWHDAGEVREVRVHVDRNAVQRHPLFHADTDGGNFVFVSFAFLRPPHPDANSIFAPLGTHAGGSQSPYDPFFQRGDEMPHVRPATSQIDHDIGHALSWPVICELTSTAALVDGEASVDHVGWVRAGAGGVEGRVLQQPNELSGPSGSDGRCARLHGFDRLFVGDRGIGDAPFDRHRSGRRWKSDCQCISRVNHSFTIPW